MSGPFRFVDYALLDTDFDDHFHVVPAACPEASLLPLDAYLALDPDDAIRKIPFVWGVDGDGRLRKLAVTRRLAVAGRDRVDFWHTLQELAGVRNVYVIEAVQWARAEEKAEAAEERKRLLEQHAEEIERVKREIVGEAMQNLAARLLDLDAGALSAMPASTGSVKAAPPDAGAAGAVASSAVEEAPAVEPAPVEEEISDEAWINTPLCTSCNDCTAINPLLFVYDQNKQAKIGDLAKGTFAQLVQAAEKCPARCIHPGQPLDPSEPGLEDLVRRAQPFM